MDRINSPSPGRLPYVAPDIEVIEVAYEGVIAGSGTGGNSLPDIPTDPSGAWSTSSMQSPYSASSLSEFEDLVNDILTFEQ